jgi:hypothetical protein
LIVAAFAASSTTTFPFHAKYSSQAWEMGTGNNPVSVCERCLMQHLTEPQKLESLQPGYLLGISKPQIQGILPPENHYHHPIPKADEP